MLGGNARRKSAAGHRRRTSFSSSPSSLIEFGAKPSALGRLLEIAVLTLYCQLRTAIHHGELWLVKRRLTPILRRTIAAPTARVGRGVRAPVPP
jgi:hypothetical protein